MFFLMSDVTPELFVDSSMLEIKSILICYLDQLFDRFAF